MVVWEDGEEPVQAVLGPGAVEPWRSAPSFHSEDAVCYYARAKRTRLGRTEESEERR